MALVKLPQVVDNIFETPMVLGQAVGNNYEALIEQGETSQSSGSGGETPILLDSTCELPRLLGKTRLAMGTFGGDNSGNVVDDLAPSGGTPQSRIPQGFPGSGSGNPSRPRNKKHREKVALDDDGSKMSTIFNTLNIDTDILHIVSTYRIPPAGLCR